MGPTGRTGRRRQKSPISPALAVVIPCVVALIGIGIWNAPRPAGSDDQAAPLRVSVFAFVDTGIVFVDPDTSEIVWKNVDGDHKTIGDDPWRDPQKPSPSTLTGFPAWREDRDIVGHPDHDLVSWVETSDGGRGDLIVVEASTGDILARTPISAPTDRSVVIAGVDENAVYFATPDPTTGFPDMPGTDIWTWSWPEGTEPVAHEVERFYNDVSAGKWAMYDNDVEFADANRQSAVMVDFAETGFTDFGGAFSPDGKYWYGSGTVQIFETATGEAIELPTSRKRNYGWTGSVELTMTDPFLTCSAVTGQCRGPASVFPDVCAPYDIVCGEHLPLN